jgi:hypothetical protein
VRSSSGTLKLVAGPSVELLRSAALELDGTAHRWGGLLAEDGACGGHGEEGGQSAGEKMKGEHRVRVLMSAKVVDGDCRSRKAAVNG